MVRVVDSAVERAIGAVVFKQMSVGLSVGKIVDRYDFECFRIASENSTERESPDSSEAVDSNAYCHFYSSIGSVGDAAKQLSSLLWS